MKRRILSTFLALCLLAGLLPGTALATDAPSGYTTDENGIMAYMVDGNTISIQGYYKGNANDWINTTYNNEGYTVAKDMDNATITADATLINGGRYAKLSYIVTAGNSEITDGKLAVYADVQIGENDFAPVEAIQDAAGRVIGLKMVHDDDATKPKGYGAQFNLYFDGTGGVTPVSTYWFGRYSDMDSHCFDNLTSETESTSSYEKDENGVYIKLTGTDSGMALSWQNISLQPGESKTFSFLVGVGEKADPPALKEEDPISLTANIQANDNGRTVDVAAQVTDTSGLTDTLYYNVDGGGEQTVGSVTADGAAKDITGQISLSGLSNGAHTLDFWVVNSSGALSPSVTREVTVTASGVEGLDTPPAPAHSHKVCVGALTHGGAACDHTETEFQPWTTADKLPSSGSYYLETDVSVDKRNKSLIQNGSTLDLCLNGHTITYITDDESDYPRPTQGLFDVAAGGVFSLCDCQAGSRSYKFDAVNVGSGDYVWQAAENGEFTLTSGYLTGKPYCGLVHVSGGDFRLYSGAIIGNSGSSRARGIQMDGGTANLYGGQVSGNKEEGVRTSGGALGLHGVEISHNGGGGVDARRGTTVTMTAGAVKDNAYCGVRVDGSFTMSGGEVTGNSSRGELGGVYMESGSDFTLTGGRITGNTHKHDTTSRAPDAAGVTVRGNSTFTLSGDVVISGNCDEDTNTPCDLFIYNEDDSNYHPMVIASPITGTAPIAVNAYKPDSLTATAFTDGWATHMSGADVADYFTSRNSGYIIAKNNAGELVFGKAHSHDASLACGDTAPVAFDQALTSDAEGHLLINGELAPAYYYNFTTQKDETTTDVTSENYRKSTRYLLPAGNYYLAGDLTLTKELLFLGTDNTPFSAKLCLNGHLIQGSGPSGCALDGQDGNMVICDCQKGAAHTVTSAVDGANVSFNGGGFTGGARGGSSYAIDSTISWMDGDLTLYGGNLVGNRSEDSIIDHYRGQMVLDGVRVSHNVSQSATVSLGDSSSTGQTYVIQDGVIEKNHCAVNESSTFGALYVSPKSQLTLAGSPDIQPSTVEGDKAPCTLMVNYYGNSSRSTVILDDSLPSDFKMGVVAYDNNFSLFTGAAALTRQGAFFSQQKGMYIKEVENEGYATAAIAITTQPTPENPAVAVNYAPEDISYQWYEVERKTEAVTDQNATVCKDLTSGNTSSYADGKWTPVEDRHGGELYYFSMDLKKGDVLRIALQGDIPTGGELWLRNDDTWKFQQVTFADDADYTFTAQADGLHTLYATLYAYPEYDDYEEKVLTASATVEHDMLTDAVTGQTAAALAATAAGTYACQITWPETNTVLVSDPVTVEVPHSHDLSVSCGSDDPVTFEAWTATDSLPSEPGHYYLTENVTLSSPWYGVQTGDNRTIDLCLNGKTVTFAGQTAYAYVSSQSRLNLCDCQEGGKLTSAAREGAPLQVGGGAATLYGGTIERAATYSSSASYYHAVDVLEGDFHLMGGTLRANGIPLHVRFTGTAYLSGAPTLTVTSGDFPNIRIAGNSESFSALYAHGEDGGAAYAGDTLAIIDYSECVGDGTVIVHGVTDGNQDKFTLQNGGFFMTREGDGLIAHPYAITTQPTAGNSYTVVTNHPDGASYQWCTADVTAVKDTTTGATPDSSASCDEDTGAWTTSAGDSDQIAKYFSLPMKAGDSLLLTPVNDSFDPDSGQFMLLGEGYENQAWSSTIEADGKVWLTAPADDTYTFIFDGSGAVPTVQTEHLKLTPVSGQTAATLSTTAAGTYVCQVTWADGTVLASEPVTVAAADQGETKGEVVVKDDAPAVEVNTDDLKDLAGEAPDGQTVTVKLTVEKQDSPTDKADIDALVSGKKDAVLYLDLSLFKQVDEEDPEPITDTQDKVLEIAVDYDLTGKKDVTVYRKHGETAAQALTPLSDRPAAENFADGSFFADAAGGKVFIYASKFSTYAIAYTEIVTPNPTPGHRWPDRQPAPEEPVCPKDETCPISAFSDAQPAAWYHDGVHFCLEEGLMVGTSDTAFEPGTTTNRAMIATILWRVAGSPAMGNGKSGTFPDVAENAWYTDAIEWAAASGVVTGYDDGNFGPDDPITREQLATMLYRYEQIVNGGGFTGSWMFLLDFADADQVSSWADEAMHYMTMHGVITGKDEDVLDPQGQATRAEAATMLQRFLETDGE